MGRRQQRAEMLVAQVQLPCVCEQHGSHGGTVPLAHVTLDDLDGSLHRVTIVLRNLTGMMTFWLHQLQARPSLVMGAGLLP
jgi:hypothetical protein